MPRIGAHEQKAHHNCALLCTLNDLPQFHDWSATVAFYTALHIVESVFGSESPPRHTTDHRTREDVLKATNRYRHLATNYLPLSRVASIARYMVDEHSQSPAFSRYMTPDMVRDKIIKHHLLQVAQSAAKILRQPGGTGFWALAAQLRAL